MCEEDIISDKVKHQYPMLNVGFKPTKCPICAKICYPVSETKIGTIRYNNHKCFPLEQGIYRDYPIKNRSHGILVAGEFILQKESRTSGE